MSSLSIRTGPCRAPVWSTTPSYARTAPRPSCPSPSNPPPAASPSSVPPPAATAPPRSPSFAASARKRAVPPKSSRLQTSQRLAQPVGVGVLPPDRCHRMASAASHDSRPRPLGPVVSGELCRPFAREPPAPGPLRGKNDEALVLAVGLLLVLLDDLLLQLRRHRVIVPHAHRVRPPPPRDRPQLS